MFINPLYPHFSKNMKAEIDRRKIQDVPAMELAARWLTNAENLALSSRRTYAKRIASLYKSNGTLTEPRTPSARSALLGTLQWRAALRINDALPDAEIDRINAGKPLSPSARAFVEKEIAVVQAVAALPCRFDRGRGMKTRLRRITRTNPKWPLELWEASNAYQDWRHDLDSHHLWQVEREKQNCLAVMLAYGVRVGELAQGITPSVTSSGAIQITLEGNKRRDIDGELPRGQPTRTIEIKGDMPWHFRLREIAAAGGTIRVPPSLQGPGLLGKWVSQRARAAGIEGMSAHLLRHSFESDQKVAVAGAANGQAAALQAAAALGHASAASRHGYGSARTAGLSGSVVVSARASREVRPGRLSAAERFAPRARPSEARELNP